MRTKTIVFFFVAALCSFTSFRCGTVSFRDDKEKQIIVPQNFVLKPAQILTWKREFFSVTMQAQSFSQGDVVYLKIGILKKALKDYTLSCIYGAKQVLLSSRSWGYRGFFALSPNGYAGRKRLRIVLKKDTGTAVYNFFFKVKRSLFAVYRQELKLGRYSDISYQQKPKVVAYIKQCISKKRIAFKSFEKDRIDRTRAHPRNEHHITSPFWAKRIYYRYVIKNGRRKRLRPRFKIHRGLDLRGIEGAPVYALAGGLVVLAEQMFYEGNFTVIDHGNRIFSYYMHQKSLAVKAGQVVRGGDLIGQVGSTGMSTAAHLHISLVINGVHVDPLSILPLSLRD